MNCPRCGKELLKGAAFCGNCGMSIPVIPEPEAVQSPNRRYDQPVGKNTGLPAGIVMGSGEKLVKLYQIGRYTLRSGEIYVIITNKRVIRYEESSLFGMKNSAIDEVNVDVVHGTATEVKRSVSLLGLSLSLILLIIAITLITTSFGRTFNPLNFIIGLAALLATGFIVSKSLQPSMSFKVLTSHGSPSLGTLVNSRGRFMRGGEPGVVFQFKPTNEVFVMLKEIGALIYDIKTLGDSAIDNWS